MSVRKRRLLAENIAGSFMVLLGLAAAGAALWYHREQVLPALAAETPSVRAGSAVQAEYVSGQHLQARLDAIADKKRQIEREREEKIRAALEAKRKEEEEARRKAEEEKRKAEEARRKAEEEKRKAEEEKAKREKARLEAEQAKLEEKRKAEEAKRKAEEEKAKREKERLAEEQAKLEEKRKAEEVQRKAAEEEKRRAEEKAKREKAEREKARLAEEQAKLDAIGGPPALEISSFGGDAQGTSTSADGYEAAFSAFDKAVKNKVREEWISPNNIPEDAHATVLVRFDEQGNVTDINVSVRSGYPLYDDSVVAAVRAASPFPMPEHPVLLEEILREGVELEF